MGWSSGTDIFDAVAFHLLSDWPIDRKLVLKDLYETLRDHDWDTTNESQYYRHPLVREIIKEADGWEDEDFGDDD